MTLLALTATRVVTPLRAGVASASTYGCESGDGLTSTPTAKPTSSRLLFGIFPGGSAGTVLPMGSAVPDNPAKELASVQQLAGGRPFVLHEYTAYTGDSSSDEQALQSMRSSFISMAAQGLFTELVVRYMPSDGGSSAAVKKYASFIRHVVDVLGPNSHFLNLQVTNEVNFTAAGNTSDGSYTDARDALIQGVEAAKDEEQRDGFTHLGIGFNWFYRMDPNTENSFWTYLAAHGGPAFDRAVDWVGLDAYPGTFYPPSTGTERGSMINALSDLRRCFMRAAGLGSRVQIHVVENGWPTGPGRSDAMQSNALQQMAGAVQEYRGNYGVTDYRWFDLRDANSSGPDFEQHYGLETDTYAPKPAFGVYRSLIASLDTLTDPTRQVTSAPASNVKITISPRHGRACSRGRIWVQVTRSGPIQLKTLSIFVNRRRVRLLRSGFGRRLHIRLRGRRSMIVTVRVHATNGTAYTSRRRLGACSS